VGFTAKLGHASLIWSQLGSMAGRRNRRRDFKGAAIRQQARSLTWSDGARFLVVIGWRRPFLSIPSGQKINRRTRHQSKRTDAGRDQTQSRNGDEEEEERSEVKVGGDFAKARVEGRMEEMLQRPLQRLGLAQQTRTRPLQQYQSRKEDDEENGDLRVSEEVVGGKTHNDADQNCPKGNESLGYSNVI